MTDITSAQAAATTTTDSGIASNAASAARIGEEFNTFLELLTAQVRNQDPLSPLDSTQFVDQLATFSSLEQEVRSNDYLSSISSMMSNLNTMMASEWIGSTVSVESSWVPYSGETVDFSAELPETADKAILTVRDADGTPVLTTTLKSKDGTYSWDGRLEDGGRADPGSIYQFAIDVFEDGRHLGAVAPKIITTVTEVGASDGEVRVGTSAQLSANLTDVERVSDE